MKIVTRIAVFASTCALYAASAEAGAVFDGYLAIDRVNE